MLHDPIVCPQGASNLLVLSALQVGVLVSVCSRIVNVIVIGAVAQRVLVVGFAIECFVSVDALFVDIIDHQLLFGLGYLRIGIIHLGPGVKFLLAQLILDLG